MNPCPPGSPCSGVHSSPLEGGTDAGPLASPCWDTSSTCASREEKGTGIQWVASIAHRPPFSCFCDSLIRILFTLAFFYPPELVYSSFTPVRDYGQALHFYALSKKQWEEKIGNCLRINGHWLYWPLSAAMTSADRERKLAMCHRLHLDFFFFLNQGMCEGRVLLSLLKVNSTQAETVGAGAACNPCWKGEVTYLIKSWSNSNSFVSALSSGSSELKESKPKHLYLSSIQRVWMWGEIVGRTGGVCVCLCV